jgi:S-adenosylmethionine:tRNA ribosyltransferase-isomerase
MDELAQYDYELPRDAIAQHPLPRRTDARLLVLNRQRGSIEHSYVRDLTDWLRPGDALVLNDTRVIPARVCGYRERTRGRWEGLFLREDTASGCWEMLSKTRGQLQPGERIVVQDRDARDAMCLEVVARLSEGKLAVRSLDPATTIETLERVGRIPIPPYIRDGRMVDDDVHQYQTVYAAHPGSVAAPTAGLHFTKELLAQLARHEVSIHHVTLHVGIGTFRPIQVNQLSQHQMHHEWVEMPEATAKELDQVRTNGGRVIAVGTTTARVLESVASAEGYRPYRGTTNLFIRPPYSFAGLDGMMTNFHLPRSSLLVMVAALAGRELVLQAYDVAIREGYRFYSYGDAMLIQ